MDDLGSEFSEPLSLASVSTTSSLLSRRGCVKQNLSISDRIEDLFAAKGTEFAQAALQARGYVFGHVIGRSPTRKTMVMKANVHSTLVAVKVAWKASEELTKAIMKENDILSCISHPHIVAARDLIQIGDSSIALVLQFCPGILLQDCLRWDGQLPTPSNRVQVLEQLLSALAILHEHGVAHLCIRPKNIMVDLDTGAASFGPDGPVVMIKLVGFDDAYSHAADGGDWQARCRKDVFGAGLVAVSLVAGRELKTKDIYLDSSLVLPYPPDSKELTPGAVDWLTAVVSLEQDIRPSASHALETLPTGCKWFKTDRVLESL
eukprot:TRINITY_DN18258_c0_g1_i1.p1 TRINITY_DN18258_c0_g1~~TRINITY_DN18258_c0_g1_i1.p1  ORF type:complete len:319 (+),score=54.62 TRINITY_DN18258_c0_g1_i1:61-1017(+)